jgi:hypothetical protein
MMNSTLRSALCLAAFATICALPAAVAAQDLSGPWRVVSVDPYGLATRRLTAEAEFCNRGEPDVTVGCRLTTGVTASLQRHPRSDGSTTSTPHADLEGFIRVRDGGLSGPWAGVRTGLAFAEHHGLRLSLGVEAGVSRLIARRIYAGASVGAKRIILPYWSSDLRNNPSFRVAAGYVF